MFETSTDKELQEMKETLTANSILSRLFLKEKTRPSQSTKLEKGIEENMLLIQLIDLEIERRRTSGWTRQGAGHTKEGGRKAAKSRKNVKAVR